MGRRIYRPGQILKLTLSLSESLSFFCVTEFLESFTPFKLLILEIGFCSTSLSVEDEQLTGFQRWRLLSCFPVKVKKRMEARFSPFKYLLGMGEERWEMGGGSVCVCVCVCPQSCLSLCDPTDCSLPGSSVHGVLQARILERIAISFFRGSSNQGIELPSSVSSALAGRFFTTEPPWDVWGEFRSGRR